MKLVLQLEEVMMGVLALFFITLLPFSWFTVIVCLLAPDIGMAGYLINSQVGAITYNLTHHKGLSILLLMGGILLSIDVLTFAGLIMFAHSSFDRALGFGLKYADSFQHTHLGHIGRAK